MSTDTQSESRNQAYLASIPLVGGYAHTYVICRDRQTVQQCVEQMMGDLEAQGAPITLPVILMTGPLKKKAKALVERHLSGMSEEVAGYLREVKDFHQTVWMLREDHPDFSTLLDIH